MRRLQGPHLRDLLLVALALSMGSLDAVSWLGLGRVYSAFQTGNIVVLGFGAAGAAGPPVVRGGASLAAFAIGAFVASRFVARDVPGAVWPRPVTLVLGTVVMVQAAFLALWLAVHGHPSNTSADVLIGVGGLAAGLQTGAIFSLGVRAVFTTAATATVTAIMSDLANGRHAPRDLWRLTAVVLSAFAGATAGGLLMDHARELAPVLTLAVTTTVVATAWLVLGHDPSVATGDRDRGREGRGVIAGDRHHTPGMADA